MPKRNTRRIRVAAAGIGATSAALMPLGTATAYPGATNQSPIADNYLHTYAFSNVEQTTRDLVNLAMSNLDNQSDIASQPVSVSSITDAVILDEDYRGTVPGTTWTWDQIGNNTTGQARCVKWGNPFPGVCDRFDVRFDLDDTLGMSANGRKALGCHEIGHTVGLAHPPISASTCMMSQSPPNQLQYDADEVHILNLLY